MLKIKIKAEGYMLLDESIKNQGNFDAIEFVKSGLITMEDFKIEMCNEDGDVVISEMDITEQLNDMVKRLA